MPRWRALPDELDPQVKEFAGQLRRLVERSGLSISAVADRTGYSKTSWERYLNGRLLPPRRAVVALAEATGAHAGHLTTLWELAERAWSRSEMRHDVTMEAIQVAQARAALGEFGPAAPAMEPPEPPAAVRVPQQRATEAPAARVRGDFPAPGGHPAPAVPPSPATPPAAPAAPPAAVADEVPDPERRRRITMFVTGVVGALLLIAAALHAGCTGKDPEEMGCGGTDATTPSRGVMGGALIEVRYSKVCGTAWARLTGATQGDRATVTSGGRTEEAKAGRDGSAYTAMVRVSGAPEKVRACGTTNAGYQSCTEPEGATGTGPDPAAQP
ncbi:helix-turn-helix domain-containing protein [Streptomyces purpurogeneiscleroticus]|uniref:helix-turn-helix domain-containing protein n=1 Tax=Streptomyces purpurogeneiscleroticus TaxID=68259 RepID=UPI001CBFDF18|nr:XRE family transcriptional regulator [Streptomyces purpurogeneiscleroticus]MBZ4015218.1 hypothetical protein [Streptomyces purpurogeneiscleroticus]